MWFLTVCAVKEIDDASWADEEPFQLPSAPRGMGELPSGPGGAFGGSGMDAHRRPGRFVESQGAGGPPTLDMSRIPSSPPFVAFIGNLPFDVTETDMRTFFQMRGIAPHAILQVKLPVDAVERRSRGFGYVDFATVEDLTRALLSSNQFQVRNRVVRVDVSDGKPQSGREPHAADTNRSWRDSATPMTAASPFGQRERGGNGVGFGFDSREQRESRDPREPRESREMVRNWREGATPVHAESRAVPARAPFERAERPAPEPMRNWRESAKPVEGKPQEQPRAMERKESAGRETRPPKPPVESSKVPTGSWRRPE